MKIAILYYSVSGNTKSIGEYIEKGIKKYENIETKLMHIDEVDEAFLLESKAVIFGSPTYYASIAWQMKKWFDTAKINLNGKIGSCYATANSMGGGSEIVESGLITLMVCKGMLVYTGGTENGQPFTHLGAVSVKAGEEFHKNRAEALGERIAKKVLELFS